MKKFIGTFIAITLVILAFGQNSISEVATSTLNKNWWTIHASQGVEVATFFDVYGQSLGADSETSFVLIREEKDALGMVHSRYAQYKNGILVEGAQFILHSKNGFVLKANGKLVSNLKAQLAPAISFAQALSSAKSHLKNASFSWENPAMEAWIKSLKKDENASFFPREELVLIDPNFSQNGENYVLAYKLDLFYDASNHTTLYINAVSGAVVFEEEGCHTGAANGVAHTKYHGIQPIITDSINASKFVLVDNTRGGGIKTYNLATGTNYGSATLFEDADNNWNNFNPQQDEIATDVHWSTEMAYDYYLSEHNRNSYDNLGAALLSYVHYDSNYANAFWNGMFMTYGDGYPLTGIDVVGHELTHGVTEYAANLIYSYESGALNESFSDIFGTHIKFKAFADSATWGLGVKNFEIRDMSDPKLYNQPDTYLGPFWVNGAFDNGGVHFNSGVQNFWYYLLSVGGSGTNDLGNAYTVDSIGQDAAADIAYRNLVYYLTPTSQYYDARQGAIEAAEDIFGTCSNQVLQVVKAWYAVGLGADVPSPNVAFYKLLAPLNSCNLGAQEPVSFQFIFQKSGCTDSIIPVGDSIAMKYSIDNSAPVVEYFVATSPILNNDTVSYTFTQKADFTTAKKYFLNVWVDYAKDFLEQSDSLGSFEITKLEQISTKDSITFEGNRAAHESKFYSLASRANSKAVVSVDAKYTGFSGLKLTGFNPSFNIDTAFTEADNFILNPEYQSDFCACIDARNWNYATLSFDLKQTYSGFYQPIGGLSPATFASSLRVVINGQQVGWQYHPTTINSDPFVRQYVVLDNYAGQEFEFCFQGKHFFDKQSDFANTDGDNSYVDNIKFEDLQWISIPELEAQDVKVLPNPAYGAFEIELNSYVPAAVAIQVVDQLGRTVQAISAEAARGLTTIPVQMKGFAAGIYFVNVSINNKTIVKKLVLR